MPLQSLVQKRVDGLTVGPDPLPNSRLVQLATLAVYHRVPAIYFDRAFAEAGGMLSYGANVTDQHRQLGIYTGRILKGEKPADLPVLRATKFELVINLKTAKTLGLDRAADAARPRRRGDRVDWLASFAASAYVGFCAGFRTPATTDLATRSGGRRPKSAKARNRVGR